MKLHIKNIKGCKINALPVGLEGKIYGMPFFVSMQYDITGNVSADVYENFGNKDKIVSITGDKKNIKREINLIATAVFHHQQTPADQQKDVEKAVSKLVKQISGEVHTFNKANRSPQEVQKPDPLQKDQASKHKQKIHKPMARKKRKGATIKYIDRKGRENKTYEIKRDKEGHFEKFNRIAGFSGVNLYSELDKEEKCLKHWETAAKYWKDEIKKKLWDKPNKHGQIFPKSHYTQNLKYAKAKLKICKRRVKEQKAHIRKMLK